ncbi:hypothetical protein BJ085DRAFT_38908 [Dimargaris cristalligena]|uniref:Uncharacterized protein n=1 Tax=Dimargaris cristalligena TaxID=215637 RepID=A0A4P9ZXM4_9FUNG|nr:hypothetical protein BJ085DRAFT_38908 [Dimargaris cristalligena]|eukprot:RKP38397.1 hypothetical protein BJ085DRAFT_38908 [Dimargaris cristalligena]
MAPPTTWNSDTVVQVDHQWFTNLNLAMLAYAASLVVHFSNFLVSSALFWKHRHSALFAFLWVHALLAISCHFSRMSDYFFSTNCQFKGYYNYSMYLIATSLALVIWTVRAVQALPAPAPVPSMASRQMLPRPLTGSHRMVLAVGSVLACGKVAGFLAMFHSYFEAAVGQFSSCDVAPTPTGINLIFIPELAIYVTMLLLWSGIIYYRLRIAHPQPWSLSDALYHDGARYNLTIGILSTTLAALILATFQTGIYVEVPVQIKYAVDSLFTVKQMVDHHRDITYQGVSCEDLPSRIGGGPDRFDYNDTSTSGLTLVASSNHPLSTTASTMDPKLSFGEGMRFPEHIRLSLLTPTTTLV